MQPDRRVALAMITWNRRERVLATLARLCELPEQPRIVVVDNGSTDGTGEAVLRRFPQVRVIRAETNLGAAGRNLAIDHLEEPYVALCDDDTWWQPGSLARGADLFDSHPELAVINARVLVEPGSRDDPACLEMAESPLPSAPGLPGSALLGFMAGASMVRRSAFLDVGGFPASVGLGGEEEWVAVALASRGWRLCYVPGICVHHEPCQARDHCRRRWHLVRNALWFAWLRRPVLSGLRRTLELALEEPWDGITARGFAAAVAGLAGSAPRRRVVPREIETGLRLLEIDRRRRARATVPDEIPFVPEPVVLADKDSAASRPVLQASRAQASETEGSSHAV